MRLNLWNAIRGRAVRPVLSSSFHLSDDFEDETAEGHRENELPVWADGIEPISGFACVIAYVDSRGRATQRLITCQRKERCGTEIYIWAWCHARESVRQFRLSRIEEVFDAQTGELLDRPGDFFDQFKVDRSQRSGPGWGLSVQLRADLTALLNVLVFMARCDRQYHPLERASLEDVIARFWLRFEAAGEPDCDAILSYSDRLAPDAETFYVALERCVGKPLLIRLLRESVRAMVDADGRLAPEEVYWGSRIDEYLSGLR